MMKLCDSEYRFMCVVWEHAPISSGDLVKLCAERLGWKKSTTYTEVKKLSEKGYLVNENSCIRVLVEKQQVQADESAYFMERTFDGSLPDFMIAFLGGRKLSEREAERLKRLIDDYKEG